MRLSPALCFPILLLTLSLAGCASSSDPNSHAAPGSKSGPAADREFEQTPKDPPFTANTHYAAGQLDEAEGRTNQAIDHYWAAVKLDPKHRDSLFRLGMLYTQLKRYPDAVTVWTKYIDATDQSADAYTNLAICHDLAGQESLAEQAYQTGITRDPKNVACRTNYGLLLARTGRTGDAIIQFQAVLPSAQVHYNLAAVYERQNRLEEAKAEYHKALSEDPNLLAAAKRLEALQQH